MHVLPHYKAQAAAVGEALQEWQNVEKGLFEVYCNPHQHIPQTFLAITFYHIRSFETKLALVDDMLAHFISKDNYAYWKLLRKEASTGVLYRNSFAHFETHFLNTNEIVLGPSIFDIARTGGEFGDIPPKLLFTVGRVSAARGAFWNLSAALHDFAERIHWSPTVQATRTGRREQGPQRDPAIPPKMHWPEVH